MIIHFNHPDLMDKNDVGNWHGFSITIIGHKIIFCLICFITIFCGFWQMRLISAFRISFPNCCWKWERTGRRLVIDICLQRQEWRLVQLWGTRNASVWLDTSGIGITLPILWMGTGIATGYSGKIAFFLQYCSKF